ncbi:Hint domain-containing protein [Polyangium aurulentum]|nr:Hint domain-containing protein [Polyangium aurulentum]
MSLRHGIGVVGLGLCVAGASCFNSCFVRGTRIVTPRGLRRIEEISVGDEVYSLDLETRRPVVRCVARVLRARAAEIFHIAAGELSIAGVTSEHPFYDAERAAWTPAGEVSEGTRLVAWLGASDVRELLVTTHRKMPDAPPVDVYNLTIDGPEHNYFAEGFLVHNKDPPGVEFDAMGAPCDSDADCPPITVLLTCATVSDGRCGTIEQRCTESLCAEGPLTTVCGCDGKPHADDRCTGIKPFAIDKRAGACTPPEGMLHCGDETCASDSQFCMAGYSEIKCADLPPQCLGAQATCKCLELAGVEGCGCSVEDGGLRVAECKPEF